MIATKKVKREHWVSAASIFLYNVPYYSPLYLLGVTKYFNKETGSYLIKYVRIMQVIKVETNVSIKIYNPLFIELIFI